MSFINELLDMIFEYIQEPQTDRLVLQTNDYFSSLFIYRNKHEFHTKDGNTLFLTKKRIRFDNMNSKNVVNFFISKGAYYLDWGMVWAAFNGHLDLVKFFISQGADDYSWGMANAIHNGHLTLVQFFINKGADDYSLGMETAARRGNLTLVKFFINKGANNLNQGRYWAELNGHTKVIEFFKQKMNK